MTVAQAASQDDIAAEMARIGTAARGAARLLAAAEPKQKDNTLDASKILFPAGVVEVCG